MPNLPPIVGYAPNSIYANFKTSSNRRYKSLCGTYKPRQGGPYSGPIKEPKFRSKIELRLMTMLDNPKADNVVSWSYESKRIPYVDHSTLMRNSNGTTYNPTRNYVVDFIVTLKDKSGVMRNFWIETKSVHDILVNKKKKKTKNALTAEKIRVKNYSKWIAAKKAAEAVNAHFLVITESELASLSRMING